jgi:hypothetical protein
LIFYNIFIFCNISPLRNRSLSSCSLCTKTSCKKSSKSISWFLIIINLCILITLLC